MKWKFSMSFSPDGKENFGVLHDDERGPICIFIKDLSDLDGSKIANAREMYEEILQFIDKVDHGSFKPKETYSRFKDNVTRIVG